MKAAHRKELQTNALADRVGKLYESVKSGPKSTSAFVWLFVLLALGALAAWKYFGSTNPETESARWVSLRQATHDPGLMARDLQNLVDSSKTTVQGRAARYQQARLDLRMGQESLVAAEPKVRTDALDRLRNARDLYEQLVRESKDFPILYQEALLGLATAEETLAGISIDESGAAYGNLDRAQAFYQKLVQFNLRQLGKRASEDQAVATMEQLVQEQLHALGQEASGDQALTAYQRLAETQPDKFKGGAAAWRDLSYTGRLAAQSARNLQPAHREAMQKFYAELNKLTGPRTEPTKTP